MPELTELEHIIALTKLKHVSDLCFAEGVSYARSVRHTRSLRLHTLVASGLTHQ